MDELNNLKEIVNNNIELKNNISNDLDLLDILELESDDSIKN